MRKTTIKPGNASSSECDCSVDCEEIRCEVGDCTSDGGISNEFVGDGIYCNENGTCWVGDCCRYGDSWIALLGDCCMFSGICTRLLGDIVRNRVISDCGDRMKEGDSWTEFVGECSCGCMTRGCGDCVTWIADSWTWGGEWATILGDCKTDSINGGGEGAAIAGSPFETIKASSLVTCASILSWCASILATCASILSRCASRKKIRCCMSATCVVSYEVAKSLYNVNEPD